MKGGLLAIFGIIFIFLVIGVIIGAVGVSFTCQATGQHGFTGFWTFITTLGKGCGFVL